MQQEVECVSSSDCKYVSNINPEILERGDTHAGGEGVAQGVSGALKSGKGGEMLDKAQITASMKLG